MKENIVQEIHLLDHDTIDKIAAGEVVERPFSVVKELVENSIDAGADVITVEIKEGGISFIRVTDNGSGIDRTQIEKAFIRHATSKIRSLSDLQTVHSLGFRGEALSSIAAVAMVEMITKTPEALMGVRYVTEGALQKECEDIGAPDGTTIIVRNLFFNTPVRRKFLKQPATEGGYISDLMEHLALSKPHVSFKYVVNGQIKFHTTGSGDLKEIIYRIYGRDIANEVMSVDKQMSGIRIHGYLGKPSINRSNRNYENYFVNGRFIKSSLIAKAIEEGYKGYLMQHKYPFTVLHFEIDTEMIDVNVHPTKMDIRFTDGIAFFNTVSTAIADVLSGKEMIPQVRLSEEKEKPKSERQDVPEPFETKRLIRERAAEKAEYHAETGVAEETGYHAETGVAEETGYHAGTGVAEETGCHAGTGVAEEAEYHVQSIKTAAMEQRREKPEQLELFEEKLLTRQAREEYKILGQIFDTYWLFTYQDKLMIMDQHAAHEKVKYEKLIKALREKRTVTQSLNPPIVVTLTGQQETVYREYASVFTSLGFEIEEFGGNEFALYGVPTDLYGCGEKELFEAVMDELCNLPLRGNVAVIEEKIASMSCKAAVKGNMSMSLPEVEALLNELLTLDNPYNCPHGRPTIISMSKYEIEKKFKRIV